MNSNSTQLNALQSAQGQRMVQLGVVLFLLGLLTGLVVPMMANPRMGLSSHLSGITNGIALIAIGSFWQRLVLSVSVLKIAYLLALYGTFANWLGTFLAGAMGAGGRFMPINTGLHKASALQEGLVDGIILTLSLSIIAFCVIAIWGLRPGAARSAV